MVNFDFVFPQVVYGIEVYADTWKSFFFKLFTVLKTKLLRIVQSHHSKTRVTDLNKIILILYLYQYSIIINC
jgi:hypothetical protein